MKKIISFAVCLLLATETLVLANTIDYPEIDYKNIETSKVSSRDSFDETIPYSDVNGYVGTYYKEGRSKVISGSAPQSKYVEITRSSSSNSFGSTEYYSSGGYSGVLSKSGSVQNLTISKNVSGSSRRIQQFNQKCTVRGEKRENKKYDPAKFDVNNKASHEYWEIGSVWSSEFVAGTATGATTPNFSTNYNDVNLNSAYYDDGVYSGSVKGTSQGYTETTQPVYMMTPQNGYTMPFVGQNVATRVRTYTYSLSGTVYASRYEQKYSGYVYTDDTRRYEQKYKGVAQKIISNTLDAQITHNIPIKLEQDTSINVDITAKNTGTIAWTEKDLIRLSKVSGDLAFPSKLYLPSGIKVKSGEAYTWNVNIPKMKKGNYNIELKMLKDNGDGHFGNTIQHGLKVYDLLPEAGEITIKNAGYVNGNKYYIKPSTNFEISTEGYFESFTDLYPSKNYIEFAKDGSLGGIENIIQVTDEKETKLTGANSNLFTKVNNSKVSKISKNNRNYIENEQQYKISGNDVEYKLYNKTAYLRNNIENSKEYKDNNKWICVDGTAPISNNVKNYIEDDNIKTTISNVVETGSGVKKVWVEYASDKGDKVIKSDIVEKNGVYEIIKSIPTFNFGETEYIKTTIKAIDNVGNESIINEELVYLFKIEATIERVLSPHEPKFAGGEKGILRIKLYGGVDKYRVSFNKTLVELDPTLNTEEDINPEKLTEIDYEFFIPLEATSGKYSVTVDAYKNAKMKSVQPKFEVSGAITDKLRTRIRLPEGN